MQRWTAIRERYDPERGDEYVFCELDESDDGDYVRFDDASDRIAALESQLAEAERTIVELRGAAEADEQRLRDAAACAGVGWFGCDTPEVLADTIAELRAALRTKGESLDVCEAARVDGLYREAFLLDERDEARRVAVWAARHRAHAHKQHPHSIEWEDVEAEERVGMDLGWMHIRHDGTDADIYRALREAMGE